MDAPATLAAASEASANSRTLRLSPPSPLLILDTPTMWYMIIYWENLILGGVWGGFDNSRGRGLLCFRSSLPVFLQALSSGTLSP